MAININNQSNSIVYNEKSGQSTITGVFINDRNYHTVLDQEYINANETGTFVSDNETGNFITTFQTGQFVSTGQTGHFATTDIYGYLNQSQIPNFTGDVCIDAGSRSSTVHKIQGYSISNVTPTTGQMLQFDGSFWTPGAIPAGGNGGGGLVYYFNQGVQPHLPTSGIVTGEFGIKELGRVASTGQTSIQSANLSQVNYTQIISFVTDDLDPSINAIPGGLFDLNLWMSSNANSASQTLLQIQLYKYDGSTGTAALLATSDDVSIYDPSVVAQYIMSIVVPQTTISTTDRLILQLNAKATANNKYIVIYFGGETPSHVHTTIPSVGGTGLLKTINGILQSPASLIFDSDISNSAAISFSKLNGVQPDLTTITAPTATNSSGKKGQIAFNSSGIFLCIETDTWRKIANLTTF